MTSAIHSNPVSLSVNFTCLRYCSDGKYITPEIIQHCSIKVPFYKNAYLIEYWVYFFGIQLQMFSWQVWFIDFCASGITAENVPQLLSVYSQLFTVKDSSVCEIVRQLVMDCQLVCVVIHRLIFFYKRWNACKIEEVIINGCSNHAVIIGCIARFNTLLSEVHTCMQN